MLTRFSIVASTSSATRVERAAVRRAEAEHGPRATQVASGLVEPGQVPRHDRDAARLQRVDEAAESGAPTTSTDAL